MSPTSRTQLPWLRMFAEGVVVVASILMAFAIDAWWAARQTAAVERELLTRLEAGFETHRQLMLERISSVNDDRSLLQRFIAMSPEQAGGNRRIESPEWVGRSEGYARTMKSWRERPEKARPQNQLMWLDRAVAASDDVLRFLQDDYNTPLSAAAK